mmetsp:Transcript_8369/g.22702  ORF Transcript_8369/g.22702 Transcript_8369/m.22702 type:complete len:204 (+) Transcript_8369:502-1113(+)
MTRRALRFSAVLAAGDAARRPEAEMARATLQELRSRPSDLGTAALARAQATIPPSARWLVMSRREPPKGCTLLLGCVGSCSTSQRMPSCMTILAALPPSREVAGGRLSLVEHLLPCSQVTPSREVADRMSSPEEHLLPGSQATTSTLSGAGWTPAESSMSHDLGTRGSGRRSGGVGGESRALLSHAGGSELAGESCSHASSQM